VDDHLVELQLEVVHPAVGVDRLLSELEIALVERRQRGPHLGLDEPAHVQDARADRSSSLVVLPHRMVAAQHSLFPAQPKSAGDVVLGFLARRLDEDLVGVANSIISPRYMYAV